MLSSLSWHRRPDAPAPASAVLLLAACGHLLLGAEAVVKELYTTNAMCTQRYCVNPVFPALDDLPNMEKSRWQKHTLANVSKFMSFCGKVLDYDPALPMQNSTAASSESRRAQLRQRSDQGLPVMDYEATGLLDAAKEAAVRLDRTAARRYFLHLSGMGVEAWDHTDPMQASRHPLRPCARSVARLVCHTYFPQAPTFLTDGQEVSYLRPCKNSCENYLEACGVECCDEGVSCVWGSEGSTDSGDDEAVAARRASVVRTVSTGGKEVLLETGYADHSGPCAFCTGS